MRCRLAVSTYDVEREYPVERTSHGGQAPRLMRCGRFGDSLR